MSFGGDPVGVHPDPTPMKGDALRGARPGLVTSAKPPN